MARARPSVALDTNILPDLAYGDEAVLDAIATLRRRLQHPTIFVPPTVLHELGNLMDHGESAEIRKSANAAAGKLRSVWKFEPANLRPVQHGIAERIAARVRAAGLLAVRECNDSLILAEAALLHCAMMPTNDAHFRDVDFRKAALELKACDVEMPLIATPREIAMKFFS